MECRPRHGGKTNLITVLQMFRKKARNGNSRNNYQLSDFTFVEIKTPTPNYSRPVAVVTTLFFMWGFLTCLNDILVPHLKSIFDRNYAQVTSTRLTNGIELGKSLAQHIIPELENKTEPQLSHDSFTNNLIRY